MRGSLSERWYRMVDVGMHLRRNASGPTTASDDEVVRWFGLAGYPEVLTPEGRQQFADMANGFPPEAPEAHAGDRSYRPIDGTLTVFVSSLSRQNVKLLILRPTGASRWHRFFDLVTELKLGRTRAIDERFGLATLEAQYSIETRGVGHGARMTDAKDRLGPELREYPGQSKSLQRVYFPKCEATAVVQDGIVMYLELGRPKWVDEMGALFPNRPRSRE